jgi:hypothetical protein
MLYFLLAAAALLFIAHVVLLFTSFPKAGLATSRYFYSHLTLWLTGLTVFIMAIIFAGTHQSNFLDYFDTFSKKLLIVGFTLALSLVAHGIVRFVVLPLLQRDRAA